MSKLSSRKLWVAVGGVVSAVLVQVGLPEEIAGKITDAMVYIICSYLVGQGVADAAMRK